MNTFEQGQLNLISAMINKARNTFNENGHLYLVWGWVIFFCSLFQYIGGQVLHIEKSWMIWLSVWLVFPYMAFYIWRKKKTATVRTYTDEILAAMWTGFGVTMFLMAFVIGKMTNASFYAFIMPVFLAVYGIPILVSGVILRFNALKAGAMTCWLLSAASIFVPPAEHVLLIAVAMLAAWIVPGYLLRNRFRKELAHV